MKAAIRQAPMLIALAQGALGGKTPETAALPSPDWAALVEMAAKHDLAPLLRAGLERAGLQPPAEPNALLRRASRAWELRYDRVHTQMARVVQALNEVGIEPLLLKGAALAVRCYPSPGLRPFGDLDLLIRREQRETAALVLEAAGYRDVEYRSGRDRADLAESFYHWAFHREGGVKVELHWSLTSPGSEVQFDLPALWQRAQPCGEYGGRAWALAPEDELGYLAVHVVRHQFRVPLRQYADAAALLAANPAFDGAEAERRARAIHAADDLTAFLGVARRLGWIAPMQHTGAEPANLRRSLPGLADYAVAWPYLGDPTLLVQAATAPTLGAGLAVLRQALERSARDAQPVSGTAATAKKTRRTAPGALWQGVWNRLRHPVSPRAVRTALQVRRLFPH